MALENNQIDNTNTSNDEISLKDLIIKIQEWFIFLKSKWKSIFIFGIIRSSRCFRLFNGIYG